VKRITGPQANLDPVAKRTATRLVLLSVTAYLLLVGLPVLRGIPPRLGTTAGTVIFAALSVGLIVLGARLRLSSLQEVVGTVVVGGLWLALTRLAATSELNRLLISPAVSVVFLLLCLLAGRLLSHILREANILLPVCVVAAGADIFTVYWGPTAKFLEAAPEVVRSLSVAIPQMGSAAGPEGAAGLSFVATMGLGDFIFLAAFCAAGARLGFDLWRTGWTIVIIVVATLATFFFVSEAAQIPLLPFIAGGFLLANWGQFHLTPAEKRHLLYATLIVGVIVVVIAIMARML